MRVILASASPRRHQLLSLIGIEHEVRPAHTDESSRPGEAPRHYAERVAREKALATPLADGDVVIAADTVVVVDDAMLGKPVDAADAARMLGLLSGRTHTVITAVAVGRAGQLVSASERVAVTFRPLSDEAIASYIETHEPMDKAGAYGIQGFGATLVAGIDGDYFTVMGLPLSRLVDLLRDVGVDYAFGAMRGER